VAARAGLTFQFQLSFCYSFQIHLVSVFRTFQFKFSSVNIQQEQLIVVFY